MPPPVHGAAMVGQYIHDSKLVNDRFDCHYINLTAAKTLQDIGKGSTKKLLKFVTLLVRVTREVIRLRPSLVYVTANASGAAFYKDFVVVQLLKALGCKVVVHYHNKGVSTRQDHWLDNWMYRRFFRRIKVILLADVLYNDVKKYVKKEDVFICPNGIPESLDAEPTAERHNKVPHLLFLSNLIASKGVWVLLDALKILKDKGYSFVCDFVGGETEEIDAKKFYEEVEKRGLNQLAIYDGKKYGDDKKEFFEKADIFTFPTFYPNETFGLVNLEAMEHKLPVVSTDEGGIPDVIKDGENGLIAEKRNADSLASCIARLLDDKELRLKMGEDGYRKFKDSFTLAAFETKFASCIDEIANTGGVICNYNCFYGKKYGAEKNPFFDIADIFVFPTFYSNECFPLVLLEAMQHSVPCISTNEGGIPSIIEDGVTGYLTEKHDHKALADKIEYLFLHPAERQQMGEAARRKYEAEFTLGKFEEGIVEILQSLLSSCFN